MKRMMRNTVLYNLLLATFFLLSTPHSLSLYAYPPHWSDDILLTPEDLKERVDPDIAVDQFNCVWAVWDSGYLVNNTDEVLYSKRDSLGNCIVPETNISINVTYSIFPRIAVDVSNNVQFIWREISPDGFGLGHAKLANDGSVIVPSHLVMNGDASPLTSTLLPAIVINKYQEINIIWDEAPSGYNQMNWTKLDSFGDTIVAKMRISIQNIDALWPGIGIDSMANVHMAYRSDSGYSDRLTYTKIDRNGNILIDNKFLGTGALATIIADRSQNIHMTYCDPAGPGNSIKYLKLDQNGNVLIGPKTLSIHEENSLPHLAMDSLQHLHVVWTFDNFVDTAGLMYAKLDTLGDFVIPPMPVVYPPYGVWPYEPRIAVDRSNRLHLVWMDQRVDSNATEDIFYKRGENETTVQEINKIQNVKRNTLRVYPNPFKDKTTISFSIIGTGNSIIPRGIVKIFNISGQLVRTFEQQEFTGAISWLGTDDHNTELPNGVYFVKFTWKTVQQVAPIIKID